MEHSELIRENCRYYLKEKKITIYRLAQIIGTSNQSLYRTLNGKGSITDNTINKLAKGLGVTPVDLTTPRTFKSSSEQKKI